MPSPTRLAAALVTTLALALSAPLSTHAAKRGDTPHDDALTTLAERSGYARTGRYDETIALCDAFAARYPERVLEHERRHRQEVRHVGRRVGPLPHLQAMQRERVAEGVGVARPEAG